MSIHGLILNMRIRCQFPCLSQLLEAKYEARLSKITLIISSRTHSTFATAYKRNLKLKIQTHTRCLKPLVAIVSELYSFYLQVMSPKDLTELIAAPYQKQTFHKS